MSALTIDPEAADRFRSIVRAIGTDKKRTEIATLAAGGRVESRDAPMTPNAKAALMIDMVVKCRSLFAREGGCGPCMDRVDNGLVTRVVHLFLAAKPAAAGDKALQGAAVSLYLAMLRSQGVDYDHTLLSAVKRTICVGCALVEDDSDYLAMVARARRGEA